MTDYNGTVPCRSCGKPLSPAVAGYSDECWTCKKARHKEHVRKGMVS